jgi:hypothetical protein
MRREVVCVWWAQYMWAVGMQWELRPRTEEGSCERKEGSELMGAQRWKVHYLDKDSLPRPTEPA